MKNTASQFMGDLIDQLASGRPDLCDESGTGFWPVPVYYPVMLTRLLNLLQEEISGFSFNSNQTNAQLLREVRIKLMQIVYEGDLGEDREGLFLKEHPRVLQLSSEESWQLPFVRFFANILCQLDAIVLMGIITRNEEGSLFEAQKLVEHRFICNGKFAALYLEEGERHGRISEEIRQLLQSSPEFQDRFNQGMALHDELYQAIILL